MSGSIKVSVASSGFAELQNLFQQLPPAIANQVLAAGVIAGAREIAKAAKQAAPRGGAKQSSGSQKFGHLRDNITARALKAKFPNKRSAIVTRGGAFWGDLLNRGTRYIPATHWYDNAFKSVVDSALKTQKAYMVAKIIQVSNKAINAAGAQPK